MYLFFILKCENWFMNIYYILYVMNDYIKWIIYVILFIWMRLNDIEILWLRSEIQGRVFWD